MELTCSVSDQPDVCEWVRNIIDLAFLGLNFSFISVAQSRRAARILAISCNVAKQNKQRGSTSVTIWQTNKQYEASYITGDNGCNAFRGQ